MHSRLPAHPRLQLVLAVAAFLLISAGCSLPNRSDDSTYGLSAVPLAEHWEDAEFLADTWRPDAYVSEVSIDVELPNSQASDTGVTFTFHSPSDTMVSLSVPCSNGDCRSVEHRQNPGYPIDYCRPIRLDDSVISSEEALTIGLENVGRNFVYGSDTLLRMYLSHTAEGLVCSDRLTWLVSFFDPASRGIQVRIDARTGELLD